MSIEAPRESGGIHWESSHMISLHPDVVQKRQNITRIPRPDILPNAFEDTISRLYAIWLRIYAEDLLQYEDAANTIELEGRVLRGNVAVSTPMFATIVGILGYSTIVIIFLYPGPQWERRVAHLPTSLAAMWAHLYASDAKELCGKISGRNVEERLKKLNTFEKGLNTEGLEDGTLHDGIFSEPEELDGNGDIGVY